MDKWKKAKQTFLGLVLFFGLLGSGLSFWQWGPERALASGAATLCLALGFWITEMLIGVFTRVKAANASAIGLLLVGKLGWWGLLFYVAKHLPVGHDGAIAVGMGAFLIALLLAAIVHYGMPSISDTERPRDP